MVVFLSKKYYACKLISYKDKLFIINDILRVENNTYKYDIFLLSFTYKTFHTKRILVIVRFVPAGSL